ncbi:hypothetical protein MM_0731 [Methanosarcina mazei Go1]|uniref:Uncharacterized protein n=1 Tax=Methanosarcina mazei (strain ATCC BAA-159 / DSM 3647 / Goe1 / Go1 / JCM 11833 / OCM 88) TaxID=192952 RepID=Q8PYW8_METMA|nr:hypothetical protein MM_0731 [Methanosarcina mazei Go1]
MLSLKRERICREVSSASFLTIPISPNIALNLISGNKNSLIEEMKRGSLGFEPGLIEFNNEYFYRFLPQTVQIISTYLDRIK